MKKLLVIVAALAVAVAAWAQQISPALVFKRDSIVPALGTELWSDDNIVLLGGKPVVGALVGFDLAAERVNIGYYFGLKWRISEDTWGGLHGSYLGAIGETRWRDLGDRLGLSIVLEIRVR